MQPIRGNLKPEQLETVPVLRALSSVSRALAELKGLASSIPRPDILINTLTIQEAKDSSEIENIVTTHDELFKGDTLTEEPSNPAAKEVMRYRQALRVGFDLVQQSGLLTSNHICRVQAELENNSAGFRKLPGTNLQDGQGNVVYTPPQDHRQIIELMTDLETVINDSTALPIDPLVKMAVIHHQFESIHPFYDGNGRTGRIINILFLVKEGLLDIPILYHSRQIVRRKADYYRLLQEVREQQAWEDWILFMLDVVGQTAREAISTVNQIQATLVETKNHIRSRHKFYSQDLINSLFKHPYTKIGFLERDLGISRVTAARYLDTLTSDGILEKRRIGRSNYYVNVALNSILTSPRMGNSAP